MSPSLRGRGLKCYILSNIICNSKVALFTRAWIEIAVSYSDYSAESGRPLYEGVDWNTVLVCCMLNVCCRPLYEGVDWNDNVNPTAFIASGRPLYEGVDWNKLSRKVIKWPCVALFTRAWIEMTRKFPVPQAGSSRPLYEGVDWNRVGELDWRVVIFVALFTRAWIEI